MILLVAGGLAACQARLGGEARPPEGAPGPSGGPTLAQPPDSAAPQDPATPPPEAGPAACASAPSPLRRLSRNDVERALGAALDISIEAARALPPDETVGPFYANSTLPPSEAWVRALMELAERAVRAMPSNRFACAEEACFATACRELVEPLWRRPLQAPDVEALHHLWQEGRQLTGTATGAWSVLVEAAIQSPEFAYQLESPALTSNELAARLAFFIWGRGPDRLLRRAAESGELAARSGLRAQVDRMLEDPRARWLSERFVVGWLDLSRLSEVPKHHSFLRFDARARAAMLDETVRFFDAVFRRQEGNLHTLLSAEWTLATEPLLPIYGLARPDDFDPARPVTLPRDQRFGILSHPSVMTVHSTSKDSSPIARGSMVLDNLLCTHIELPDIQIPELPEPVPGQSARERLAAHASEDACAACHQFIDPIGFSFERLDAIGQHRTLDAAGAPIDDAGALTIGDAADGPARGVEALSMRLLQVDRFQRCFVRQWMRLGFARPLSEEDECLEDRLLEAFIESNHDIRTLVTELAMSSGFSGLAEARP